ncbi:MAG: ABC-2 family transporter protein [Eubacteriales bacterium]|nr:ABC-2 family transporter protein [Eubacteriales bacterium]
MKERWRVLKWYLKVALHFGKLSLQSVMEYPLNFASGVCVELAYMVIKLVYLYVVVSTGMKVGSLTANMVVIFVGTYIFMTGIWMLLSGVNGIPDQVVRGDLDLIMTKPGSLQFLQTFGKYNFALALPNLAAGTILMVVGYRICDIPVTPGNIAIFIFYLLMGTILTYSFGLMASLLVFWVTSLNAVNTLYSALWDYNNMPMELYPKIIKQIGTFLIPVFLITNWSGMAVLGKLDVLQLVWGIVVPVLAFFLSRQIWKAGIRRYTSANG